MVEKTRISGFLHYRTDLGDGVRTGIVFPFCKEKCQNICHSHRFLSEHSFTLDTPEQYAYSEEEMISYLREEKILCYTQKLGITFLGGEPLQDPFFCKNVAKAVQDMGMDLQVHTCGMCSLSVYDLMCDLVDLYILRLFTLRSHEQNFPDPDHSLQALSLFEKRGYFYRIYIPVISQFNTNLAEEFALFLSEKKYLKSVILDFSHSDFGKAERETYKKPFLERGILLY